MSPVTHFLVGWMVANSANLERRDRVLVTVAGVAPDLDGLGVVVDFIAPRPGEQYFWFHQLHHLLGHNLTFALLCMVIAGTLAKRRLLAALLAGVSFHLHLFCDLIGARGPDGNQWPMPYFWPISDVWVWQWDGQWGFNAWPNVALTLTLLGMTFYLAWRRGFSPVGIISQRADNSFIEALRKRFPFKLSGKSATSAS